MGVMMLSSFCGLRSLSSFGNSAVSAFTPADLSPTVWYDPSDLSTLFRERTGASATTAATVGDPVGTILDKSGNDYHATAPSDAARPALKKTAGGEYYLDFDGVDDELDCGSFTAVKNHYMCAGLEIPTRGGINVSVWGTTSLSSQPNAMGLYTRTDIKEDLLAALRLGLDDGVFARVSGDYSIGSPFIGEAYHDVDTLGVRVNNATPETSTQNDVTAGNSTPLIIGNTSHALHFFGGVFVETSVADADKIKAREYFANKSGVTLP